MSRIVWVQNQEPVQVSVTLDRKMNVYTCDKCGRAFAVERPQKQVGNYDCPCCLITKSADFERLSWNQKRSIVRLELRNKRLEKKVHALELLKGTNK